MQLMSCPLPGTWQCHPLQREVDFVAARLSRGQTSRDVLPGVEKAAAGTPSVVYPGAMLGHWRNAFPSSKRILLRHYSRSPCHIPWTASHSQASITGACTKA